MATVATAPGAGPIAGVRDRLVASERTLAAALSEVELRGEEIESSAKSWRGCARCWARCRRRRAGGCAVRLHVTEAGACLVPVTECACPTHMVRAFASISSFSGNFIIKTPNSLLLMQNSMPLMQSL